MEGNTIRVSNIRKVRNQRFNVDSSEFDMHFKQSAFEYEEEFKVSRENLLSRYNQCFDEMLSFVDSNLNIQQRDLIGIKFQIPTMESVTPFGMKFLERQELISEMVSDLLLSVQQSNSIFEDKNLLEVTVTVIHMDTGGARVSMKELSLNSLDEICRVKKRSIIKIPNEKKFVDQKCLPRALIVAKKWNDCGGDKQKFQALFRNNNQKLIKLTDQLIMKTFGTMKNYQKNQSGAILPDLIKFGKVLNKYQITVYDDKHLHTQAVYSSQRRKKMRIYLFFLTGEKHFIALSDVRMFFSCRHHCEHCGVLSLSSNHRCTKVIYEIQLVHIETR